MWPRASGASARSRPPRRRKLPRTGKGRSRIPGTRSRAATNCISDVPGLARQRSHPVRHQSAEQNFSAQHVLHRFLRANPSPSPRPAKASARKTYPRGPFHDPKFMHCRAHVYSRSNTTPSRSFNCRRHSGTYVGASEQFPPTGQYSLPAGRARLQLVAKRIPIVQGSFISERQAAFTSELLARLFDPQYSIYLYLLDYLDRPRWPADLNLIGFLRPSQPKVNRTGARGSIT